MESCQLAAGTADRPREIRRPAKHKLTGNILTAVAHSGNSNNFLGLPLLRDAPTEVRLAKLEL